jgi:hypothetical protein
MLTANVDTPKDSQAQPSATPTLTYGEGELLTYMLGPDLDRLFSPKDRQVGAPRLASPPKVCETSPSRRPLILKVIVDEATPLPGTRPGGMVGPAGQTLLILDLRLHVPAPR